MFALFIDRYEGHWTFVFDGHWVSTFIQFLLTMRIQKWRSETRTSMDIASNGKLIYHIVLQSMLSKYYLLDIIEFQFPNKNMINHLSSSLLAAPVFSFPKMDNTGKRLA